MKKKFDSPKLISSFYSSIITIFQILQKKKRKIRKLNFLNNSSSSIYIIIRNGLSMHATLEEGRARSRASDLVTSKFNKRHKPIRTAAKTRRAIKPAITRFSLSLFSRQRRGRGKRRLRGMGRSVWLCVAWWLTGKVRGARERISGGRWRAHRDVRSPNYSRIKSMFLRAWPIPASR